MTGQAGDGPHSSFAISLADVNRRFFKMGREGLVLTYTAAATPGARG